MATPYKKVLAALLGSALLLGASSAFADRSSYVEGPVTDEKTAGDVTTRSWYVEGLASMIYSTKSVFSVEEKLGLTLVVGKSFHKYFAAEIIAGNHTVKQSVALVLKPNIQISDRVRVYLDYGYIITHNEDDYIYEVLDEPKILYGIGTEMDFSDSLYGTIGFSTSIATGAFQLGVGFRF